MASPAPPVRTGPSIRTRLLATIVALMASGLIVAGLTGYGLERVALQRSAAEQLTREAREFTTFATSASPQTGLPFASVSELLRTAIQQRAFGAADGALGLVDGRIEWTAPSGVALRLEDYPDLVAAVTRADAATTTQGRLAAAGHDFSFLVVPVVFEPTGETGAFVRATDLQVAYRQLEATYTLYAAVAFLVLTASAVIAWAVMGRLLAPIGALRRAAASIGESDLASRIPVRGRDDLSELTHTINGMLDRIESLVEDQRQLSDDVGHELRTPLTIIRGHLELLDPDDPAEVRATRALALEETERMGRLTEDLVLLATSERADFLLPAPTGIAGLTDETLDLARGLAPRPWRLDALADVELALDAQRIRQAWLQLADNAAKYSPAGSPIALGSEVRGCELWLWVRDAGPGVPHEERNRVAERHYRGRSAVDSGRRGRGLGLAIVSKIATAHAGRLDIADGPDGTTVVSIVLPLPAHHEEAS